MNRSGAYKMWSERKPGEEMVPIVYQCMHLESRIVAKITNEMRWGDGGRHTACGKVPVVEGETARVRWLCGRKRARHG